MAKTYSQPIAVRFADLDAYGHVNNATYLTYLETARTNLLLEQFAESVEKGLSFIVTKAECSYKKPIKLLDTVIVDMQFIKKGATRFEVQYLLHNGNSTVYAEATTQMAAFDQNRQRATKIPDNIKQYF